MPRDAALTAPMEAWRSGLQLATMLSEAQMVVTYRLLGQMGLWATAPGETARMIREKPVAFVQSAVAAATAAQAGKRPDQILAAAVGPLGHRTRSNMRRLARRGPGLPK
ncbi:antifreeze protein [Meridianimarinicoccus sp. RP-17]